MAPKKKSSLDAQYAAIKKRAIAAGYKPTMADIKATYRRNQARAAKPKVKTVAPPIQQPKMQTKKETVDFGWARPKTAKVGTDLGIPKPMRNKLGIDKVIRPGTPQRMPKKPKV